MIYNDNSKLEEAFEQWVQMQPKLPVISALSGYHNNNTDH
jgi:hypothetical protein